MCFRWPKRPYKMPGSWKKCFIWFLAYFTKWPSFQAVLVFSPLSGMPILGPFHSMENNDVMSKIWTDGDTVIWLTWNHCGKRRNCLLMPMCWKSTGTCQSTIKWNYTYVGVAHQQNLNNWYPFHYAQWMSIRYQLILPPCSIWKNTKIGVFVKINHLSNQTNPHY